ncbi:EpsG family protein [Peribacillus psychrosaccharolyticus]|uniref:EpsG family protein n=1 Tax=Peribacillus psychrosaccharolyticus TaxID=1407 RepID=UPI003D2D219D
MITAYLMAIILVIPVLILHEILSSNRKGNNHSRYSIVAWYVILVFVIIIGLRDLASISIEHFIHNDEYQYRKSYDLLIGTPFTLSNINSYEWGRYLLDWTLANVFKNSQMWVFCYALITNYLYVRTIKRYVKPFWFGIFLYITVGVFSFQMNQTSSLLSSAILLLGINFIIERKFWKYLLVVIIASGIHFSAWIVLPLYFVLNKKFFTKGTVLWVIISVLFMSGFNYISNIILPKTPYINYLYEINSEDAYGVNIFRVLIFSSVFIFILIFKEKPLNYSRVDQYFSNVIVVLLAINITSAAYVYIYRFNEFFIIALIYMLPRVVYSFQRSVRYPILIVVVIGFLIFGLQQNWSELYKNIIFG